METITVDRLFRVHQPIELMGTKLSVRCLSGPEMQERERASLIAGLNLDKRLRLPESDEYALILDGFNGMTVENLSAYLVAMYLSEATNKSYEAIPLNIPPFPENADDAEKRSVLEARDALEKEHQEKVDREIKRLCDIYQKSLEIKMPGELLDTAQKLARSSAIRRETNEEYAYYGLYLAICDDKGTRYFSSSKETRGLPNSVANELVSRLEEINKIDPLAWSGQSLTA